MSDLKQEAQDLANKIEYAIKTEGEITLFQPNGTRAAYALRRLAESDTALTRIRELERVADRAQKTLAMIVNPAAIKTTSVMHAFAQAQEVEYELRAALSSKDQEKTNG